MSRLGRRYCELVVELLDVAPAKIHLPKPRCGFRAAAIPVAAGPARCRSCVRSFRGPAVSRPGSFEFPVPAMLDPLVCAGCDRPAARLSAYRRNGWRDRCTARRKHLSLDHLAERRQDGHGRFFFHQLRVLDLAGGVVQNHQQVVSPLILKPGGRTPIQMQQHPRQRALGRRRRCTPRLRLFFTSPAVCSACFTHV
jgi:hypothetical protein